MTVIAAATINAPVTPQRFAAHFVDREGDRRREHRHGDRDESRRLPAGPIDRGAHVLEHARRVIEHRVDTQQLLEISQCVARFLFHWPPLKHPYRASARQRRAWSSTRWLEDVTAVTARAARCRCWGNRSLGGVPRIQKVNAGWREIGNVPGHDRHPMRESRRRDERISLGVWVWYMKGHAVVLPRPNRPKGYDPKIQAGCADPSRHGAWTPGRSRAARFGGGPLRSP